MPATATCIVSMRAFCRYEKKMHTNLFTYASENFSKFTAVVNKTNSKSPQSVYYRHTATPQFFQIRK